MEHDLIIAASSSFIGFIAGWLFGKDFGHKIATAEAAAMAAVKAEIAQLKVETGRGKSKQPKT